MSQIISKIRKIWNFLNKWEVRLAADPQEIKTRAIIFFPRETNCFYCGIAGILTINNLADAATAKVEEIDLLVESIQARGLKAILQDNRYPLEEYLGGAARLENLETNVAGSKRVSYLEKIYSSPPIARTLETICGKLKQTLTADEAWLEQEAPDLVSSAMELITGRQIKLKDALWAIERDILLNIEKVKDLAATGDKASLPPESFRKYCQINFLLNAIDRLEIRGRDSAGIEISFLLSHPAYVRAKEALAGAGLAEEFAQRSVWSELINRSLTVTPKLPGRPNQVQLVFTYKTSAVVGKLGQNVRQLKDFISSDLLLRHFASLEAEDLQVIAHTRWASVGNITDGNCHPLNNFHPPSPPAAAAEELFLPRYGKGKWSLQAALNGDIDNYHDLRAKLAEEGIVISPELTTDAKVIPLMVEKYLREGHFLPEAFRLAANDFEGSQAIILTSNLEPGRVYLSLRGAGQALYVGLQPDGYIIASEIYGLVEKTNRFVQMNGNYGADPESPEGGGQLFIIDQTGPGGLAGIQACDYSGQVISLSPEDIKTAEITTRDIDRASYPHFFLKEISESPESARKTLRGKYHLVNREGAWEVVFHLGQDVIPEELKLALTSGQIKEITVIGQGTAAVAGATVADFLRQYLEGFPLRIEARVASDFSGFCLRQDMKDCLVIAITQSGTTTDTNRAVTLARQRDAFVLAIVNRRQSDITTKVHGVFYTSDGRDIEMSVASTKAFYSQIIAGMILSLKIAQLLKTRTDDFIARQLQILEKAPSFMRRVLAAGAEIRPSAEKLVKQKMQWATVGSGPNKAAADEIRIKLSELCYKTISADIVENKKHIDLSAEPLVLVCAAGSPETVTADLVKDVAIFKAHKLATVVFTDEGERRFHPFADYVIPLPAAPAALAVILNTLAGHLWGYFAACTIDQDAAFLRVFRGHLNRRMEAHHRARLNIYEQMEEPEYRRLLKDFMEQLHERRLQGAFAFCRANTVTDLTLLCKYAAGKLSLDDYWSEFGRRRGAFSPLEALDVTLSEAIDELSRPIDAIRHQAKTVTVGTSRKEAPLGGIIFSLMRDLGIPAKSLAVENQFALNGLQEAIREIRGYTLYEIGNLDSFGNPRDDSTCFVLQKGGLSAGMKSRTEAVKILRGTKKTIVTTGKFWAGLGKSDGAPLVMFPLLDSEAKTAQLLLIHVLFEESLAREKKKALLGFRYHDIQNLINEYNLSWEDGYLDLVPLGSLLGEPVETIAVMIKKQLEEGA